MKLEIGKNYHVRTYTDHFVGTLIEIDDNRTVTLFPCCWVAETGRLEEFLATGKSETMEMEPFAYPYMTERVGITEWPFPIPKEAI